MTNARTARRSVKNLAASRSAVPRSRLPIGKVRMQVTCEGWRLGKGAVTYEEEKEEVRRRRRRT